MTNRGGSGNDPQHLRKKAEFGISQARAIPLRMLRPRRLVGAWVMPGEGESLGWKHPITARCSPSETAGFGLIHRTS